MKLDLTPEQITTVLKGVLDTYELTEEMQKEYALILFGRRNNVDPFVALKAVVKQIRKEHNLSKEFMLKELT